MWQRGRRGRNEMAVKEFIENCLDEIAAFALVTAGIVYLFWTREVEQAIAIVTLGAGYLFGKRKSGN
jgi:hypothetical protein